MMKKYKVIFDEVRSYEHIVEANSEEEAMQIAENSCDEEPHYTEWKHISTDLLSWVTLRNI
jgi:hypothetical protein